MSKVFFLFVHPCAVAVVFAMAYFFIHAAFILSQFVSRILPVHCRLTYYLLTYVVFLLPSILIISDVAIKCCGLHELRRWS